MKFTSFLILLLIGVSSSVLAQKPVYINSFEPGNQYAIAKGVIGTALDLSAAAPTRKVQNIKNELRKSNGDPG